MIFLLLVLAVVAVFYYKEKKDKEFKEVFVPKVKLSEKDRKIQQRVVKEIENFLNYNGDEQDDIF